MALCAKYMRASANLTTKKTMEDWRHDRFLELDEETDHFLDRLNRRQRNAYRKFITQFYEPDPSRDARTFFDTGLIYYDGDVYKPICQPAADVLLKLYISERNISLNKVLETPIEQRDVKFEQWLRRKLGFRHTQLETLLLLGEGGNDADHHLDLPGYEEIVSYRHHHPTKACEAPDAIAGTQVPPRTK